MFSPNPRVGSSLHEIVGGPLIGLVRLLHLAVHLVVPISLYIKRAVRNGKGCSGSNPSTSCAFLCIDRRDLDDGYVANCPARCSHPMPLMAFVMPMLPLPLPPDSLLFIAESARQDPIVEMVSYAVSCVGSTCIFDIFVLVSTAPSRISVRLPG